MENHTNLKNETYDETPNSGVISTMVFMAIAVISMIVIRYILNY